MTVDIAISEGGSNVFADLGLPDADELLIKAKLAHQTAVAIKERGLNQSETALLIGMPQPSLSKMLRGQFRGISEDKMMRCLAALGHDVTIVASRRENTRGVVQVEYAPF